MKSSIETPKSGIAPREVDIITGAIFYPVKKTMPPVTVITKSMEVKAICVHPDDDHLVQAKSSRSQVIRAIESTTHDIYNQGKRIHLEIQDADKADPIFVRQCIGAAVSAGARHIAVFMHKRKSAFVTAYREMVRFFQDEAVIHIRFTR